MPRAQTLLVVEDDDGLRNLFRTALSIAGFEVKEASNGWEALIRIEAEPPDGIVLDLKLPQVSGYDVLQDLSIKASTRNVPVVVITGSHDNLEHLPVSCVLRKPVTLDQLLDAVQRFFGKER